MVTPQDRFARTHVLDGLAVPHHENPGHEDVGHSFREAEAVFKGRGVPDPLDGDRALPRCFLLGDGARPTPPAQVVPELPAALCRS